MIVVQSPKDSPSSLFLEWIRAFVREHYEGQCRCEMNPLLLLLVESIATSHVAKNGNDADDLPICGSETLPYFVRIHPNRIARLEDKRNLRSAVIKE